MLPYDFMKKCVRVLEDDNFDKMITENCWDKSQQPLAAVTNTDKNTNV